MGGSAGVVFINRRGHRREEVLISCSVHDIDEDTRGLLWFLFQFTTLSDIVGDGGDSHGVGRCEKGEREVACLSVKKNVGDGGVSG